MGQAMMDALKKGNASSPEGAPAAGGAVAGDRSEVLPQLRQVDSQGQQVLSELRTGPAVGARG